MQTPSESPRWPTELYADFCGALEGYAVNAGAFLGPLLAVFLLYSLHVGIRSIFSLAIIPGLLAFCMVPAGRGAADRCNRKGEDRHPSARMLHYCFALAP